MGSLTFSKDVLQTIYPDSAQWMTFWDCMAVFYGNWLFDICGEPTVLESIDLGSIVASFFRFVGSSGALDCTSSLLDVLCFASQLEQH